MKIVSRTPTHQEVLVDDKQTRVMHHKIKTHVSSCWWCFSLVSRLESVFGLMSGKHPYRKKGTHFKPIYLQRIININTKCPIILLDDLI